MKAKLKHWTVLTAPAAICGLGLLCIGNGASVAMADMPEHHDGAKSVKHVLLISVDGLHQSDLAWYVQTHPGSTLAYLATKGVDYSDASTPFPSDSFPGMVGQVTGGNPRTTGVYYDDTWNRALLPAGSTSCSGAVPGAEVGYTEAADVDQNSIDAGQGLTGLPGSIVAMTGNPRTLR